MKIANPTERDFKDLEGGTPNLNREKYENSKSNFKDLEDGTAKSKSEKCELANLTERDLEDVIQV